MTPIDTSTDGPISASGTFAWAIIWDDAILLDGPIEDADERTRPELVAALTEAGCEDSADQERVLDLHAETIAGPYFRH